MVSRSFSPSFVAGLRIALVTALAYAAAGALALMLAGPPGYASPLYPSAGIALAAVLTFGRAALPGVLVGAFVVNTGLGLLRSQVGFEVFTLPLIIAFGATLQAAAGAALLRRFAGPEVVLNAPRDIALAGALGGLLACTISPSIATPVLVASGALPAANALGNWLTWWSGDVLGVLIAAPLVLTLVGQPAADWRPRRRTLGVPLLLALALVTVAMLETDRLNRDRQLAVFQRDADRLAAEAQSRLKGALHALKALQAAALVQGGLDQNGLRQASAWWLAQPLHLQATGYSVRVALEHLAAFETDARAQGSPNYRIFDRDDGSTRARRGEVVVVRHIEPERDNAAALGVNALSIPAARDAIDAARRSGEPVSTAAFRLTQSSSQEAGVVLYQALYTGQPTTEAQRQAQFSGVVFVTLRTESALAGLTNPEQSYLRWCLKDADPAAGWRHLAGPPGCEDAANERGRFNHEQTLLWGGRTLSFSVWADPGAVPGSQREATWLLALSGMAASAMLGALLLTVTGHTRRTELAVLAGTQELRDQVAVRERTEAALRESSDRLRSILDSVPLGVIFMDPRGHLIDCNPRFCEMAGRPASELLGHSVANFAHAGDAFALRQLRRQLQQGQAASTIDSIRLRSAQGPDIAVRLSAGALRGPQGELLRMVGVVEDISEHLRLLTSERALHRAEAANRAKSEFLSRMSHELRTPLNAMIGFAQLLGMDRAPALLTHQLEWAQQIQRASWHLLEMINETLDLARIDSGAVPLSVEPVALAPQLAACQALVEAPARQHRVQIELAVDDEASAVMADGTRLKQVVTNLLSNAVKYNHEGGGVTLHARRNDGPEGARVDIVITDTGLGMTADQLSSLFQPYNRLGREHTSIEGTGIGLVISRRLAELMGGTLEATSEDGKGSVFTLSMPAAAAAEVPLPRYSESSATPYRQRLVHYVEDNETNIEVMRGILAQREQIKLETTTLGLDGLTAIRNSMPDLVLLDMQLPDISGLELLRHLTQDDVLAAIPVVVVSADATTLQTQKALTSGALHYVTKPVDVASFLVMIDEILEQVDTKWG